MDPQPVPGLTPSEQPPVAPITARGAVLTSQGSRLADDLAFALELNHRSAEVCAPLELRVGMATGHALLFEGDDYIGSAVNMAARLCDAAGPHEVLLPTMQIERLPQGVHASTHHEIELRGFPGPVDVVELTGHPLLTATNDTGELWTRSPFTA